jgi:hypothetical protein
LKVPSNVRVEHLRDDIPKIFDICFDHLNKDYFKIVSEDFKCINAVFYILKRCLS